MASLPLALDPVLSLPAATQQARRTLGDNFDERLKLTTQNFTTTIDNKVLFACGFWDNSFRVFHSESGNDKEVLKIIKRAVCNVYYLAKHSHTIYANLFTRLACSGQCCTQSKMNCADDNYNSFTKTGISNSDYQVPIYTS